jgi:hypothetical protein
MLRLVLLMFLLNRDFSEKDLAINYIKSNLDFHIYYFLDFKKDEILKPSIYLSNEEIPIMLYSFRDKINEIEQFSDSSKNKSNDKWLLDYEKKLNYNFIQNSENEIVKIEKIEAANYIIFFSRLHNGVLTAEILFKKERLFTKGYNYNQLKHFNSGIRYLFYFENNCIKNVLLEGFSYD